MTDYTQLPEGLPVPEDDGAADGLAGRELPELALPSTGGGELDLRAAAAGLLVAYVYPRTGTPGEPSPEGWDDIPGARGCTPQSCAYRDAVAEFGRHGADLVGISAQSPAEQAEFAAREHIPYPLLCDEGLRLAATLGLPTFETSEGDTFYRRLTFVAEAGRIVKVFYPVFPPDRDAAEVLAWLADREGKSVAAPSPRLEDDLVALRPWALGDLPAIGAAVEDPEIVRRSRLPSRFGDLEWFEQNTTDQLAGKALRLLLVDPTTDRLLGATSLVGLDPARRTAELGYWIVAAERGRGIGRRAIRLLVDWAFAQLELESISASTDIDNAPSRALLEKLGFELVGMDRDAHYVSTGTNHPN